MINLYALTDAQLRDLLVELGEKPFRAQQIRDWIYGQRIERLDDMRNLPRATIGKLTAVAELGELKLAAQQVSRDGTIKRVYELRDGQLIESVLMPYADGRMTACISSQAGCAMGCVFCATGQMGFSRNLTSAEIFEQAMRFARELAARGQRLSNVVFMGMGEPFHNYEATLAAVHLLMRRLGIGARHITISTVGLAPQIRRFADEGLQVKLAVSLHKSDDAQRSKLLPINRRWDIAALLDACRYYCARANRRISFEWAAIAGENDTIEEARRLGRLLQDINCHVNIIPLNPTGDYTGIPADARNIEAFQVALRSFGVGSTVRVRRGIDIAAGCGQLKTALLLPSARAGSTIRAMPKEAMPQP
ncbi:MAG: 23S rRNA (adenine(2503)-C(2))-methyltransferase RlmN [Chloroflexi bacterium]|nr:23S rRNA (adenine(2503)-C(2))-methyltransferase RlmN [Chloroflexota bacterium]MCY3581509.1 23S rRNA (adenine(2503)-C(2))-methyltransferase RlmN [Chloroflexota bacterium]MCY3716555.1 23S rRNA (adenine(2503)-C(2))-methyltransferase RlmN [Chloroflexota bacterium]MDE2651664.1 23S rRNA (adenine(2503)-C(2))-methyltransferase RlmN [Chloroflexota bacterium]MXV92024.1 23S rRNA (adenine(2503)-C(2))-methyltransferase RlmN [Chloroflexota bacterium]